MIKIKKIRCEYKENPVGIDVSFPRLSWQLESDKRGVLQTAYRIQVSKKKELLSEIVWDSGKVESDQSIHVEYKGLALKSKKRYFYHIQVWVNSGETSEWSEMCYWEMGLLKNSEWVAEWITTKHESNTSKFKPSPMHRKTFVVKGKVASARIYATSLGIYELYLNGAKVGNDLYAPGWTSYNKRLQYQVYDVTEQLKENSNAIGVVLGDGWYRGYLGWEERDIIYGDKLAALVQLHILYENGKEEIIVSDRTWKTSTGPILMSNIYMGEEYDARLEKDGWCSAEYDVGDWNEVDILEHSKEILVAQENVPVKIIDEIKPIGLLTTAQGDTVLDMGQNMVGWMRFKLNAQAGTVVTLQHAEVLDKDGNFYTDNLRAAKQTIMYTAKGNGEEIYEPHFSFQGFRYVKISGFPETTEIDHFMGIVVHSDMEPTGSFVCSDELINQLQHNIQWGQKGNFLDVPTDCPQRDERLGWTGDAQVFMRTACFNMNVAVFFTKWLRDLKADQSLNLGVPNVVPQVLDEGFYSSAAWADSAVICPWTMYLCYGDKRILEEQYDSIKLWIEYIRHQGDNEFLWNTGNQIGDWLGLDSRTSAHVGGTSKDFIATAFYAYSTSLIIKTAEVLDKADDIKIYSELYTKIIENFRKEFITQNGRLAVATQTAHVLALTFDLVEKNHRKRIAETLVEFIEEQDNHLTTGFVGTPYLCFALSDNGYLDRAYKLLLQKDYPSWLFPVTKGATTIWEHWDGIKEDGSFWNKDMNSFNHYSYGAVGDWMYRVIGGIDTDSLKPGYKRIKIEPQLDNSLSFAKTSLQTMYGEIKSVWEVKDGAVKITICIPSNTTGTVVLPKANIRNIYEGENKITEIEGVKNPEQLVIGTKFELGSGNYCFTYKL